MEIITTRTFNNKIKKFNANQKKYLYEAIHKIIRNSNTGERKVGDLNGIFVYKFQVQKNLMLLAYMYDDKNLVLTLLSIGSFENFYRNLKNQIK